MECAELESLRETARQIRCDILRMIHRAGSGHPGASLSTVEIITALYFKVMHIDPTRPKRADRDRFILSKGHACPALYSALARRGYFPLEELATLRRTGSKLQGHPDMRKTPGVDMTSGSLGSGLSCGVGMALAGKMDGLHCRVYVLLGDGEIQEGAVWEAAMTAAHYRLDNLTAVIDNNRLQLDGFTCDVMDITPIAEKWASFRWNVLECDGHDLAALVAAFESAAAVKYAPSVIIANTVKGKGVSFMENQCDWHGRWPDEEETRRALEELGETL